MDRPSLNKLVVRSEYHDQPDQTEQNQSDNGRDVGVRPHDLRQHSQLGLKRRLRLLDCQCMLLAIGQLDLLLFERVLADCKYNCLARSRHDDGVLEKNGVRILCLVPLDILIAALLHAHLKAINVRVELFLVDSHVHLFD